MPRTFASILLISALVFVTGCTSLRQKGSSSFDEAVFRESAADVTNRAPSSMSVPGENSNDRMNADYHYALAETYSLQGDSARAIEEYKLTLVYDAKSVQVKVRLAAEYVKQGLVSEALEHAKAAVQLDPNYTDAHLLLGGLYSALRMYEDALKEYRTVQSLYPNNTEAPLFAGAILAEQKKFSEASAQFEALATNSGNTSAHVAWYYLGRVFLEEDKSKNASKAEGAFMKSLQSKANYLEATLALGQLFESTQRKEKAQKLFQAYQEKHGPSAAVAEELARLFIEAKDYPRAFDQLAILENSDPTDINVKAKMAFILIEQQKYREAILRLEDVLAMEPASDKIRFYLGAVYEEIKDYKSAVTHFQKVPIGSSYFNESIVHAAYLHKLLGDYNKAIETVQQGIRIKDDHAPFYALFASILDDLKQYNRAASMLSDAVKKIPNHAQLYFFLGNMQDRVGDKEGTVASMRKVLAIDGNHVQALNFLAYTYAELGRDLADAESLARRAHVLQPNDGYIMDTLGWILLKRGSAGEAVKMLEAAYKAQPNEAIIAEHLGDAYYQQHLPEKAKKLYLRAAENETNVGTLEKIRGKISAIDRQVQAFESAAGSASDSGRKPASSKAH